MKRNRKKHTEETSQDLMVMLEEDGCVVAKLSQFYDEAQVQEVCAMVSSKCGFHVRANVSDGVVYFHADSL